ncbi:MAG TPA: prepilin-type N-terminal cleavage/methylation domain-containing protein [Verrucomicrobiae bacterium]|nr:prepilin-type N-terminal cleavage/methylation domain-containing protein [Verrucomicrobiae bacterium]
MIVFLEQNNVERKNSAARAAFTLAEVVVAIAVLALVMAGMIYGYVQTNRQAEWSSLSLSGQSLASQNLEQARAAQWDVHTTNTDELGPQVYTRTNSMIINPSTGKTTNVITTVTISSVFANPPLRQIRADCVWKFPRTGQSFTNTVITYRAPDA